MAFKNIKNKDFFKTKPVGKNVMKKISADKINVRKGSMTNKDRKG